MIAKKPENPNNYKMYCCFFESARRAFTHVLSQYKALNILIPAYIGYSSREGSGVFDPIQASGVKYRFYKVDRDLYIEMTDLQKQLSKGEEGVLLLIHYFGFIDPHYSQIKELAVKMNYVVVEDYAHALFTFLYGGVARNFDHAFFSLHKMLPYNSGGMLLSKYPQESERVESFNLYEYDCYQIAQRRCENYNTLRELMKPLCSASGIHLLRDTIGNAVPQTFPILLPDTRSRDRLYFGLNNLGYGVVSLYHELIQEISRHYDDSHFISNRILNLPVHQDVNISELGLMVQSLKQLL